MLRIDPQNGGVAFDGIRWANDWYLPASQVTDYSVEIWQGASELSATLMLVLDDPQIAGAPPLEAVDEVFNVGGAGQALFLRIRAGANYSASSRPTPSRSPCFSVSSSPDARSSRVQLGQARGDSRNPALIAVGAIDPANGSTGVALLLVAGPDQRRPNQA